MANLYQNIYDRCNKKIYNATGTWNCINNDTTTRIDYYYETPLSYATSYDDYAKEKVIVTCSIRVFGNHHFLKGDVIILEDGTKLYVVNIKMNFRERNARFNMFFKPIVYDQSVTLQ